MKKSTLSTFFRKLPWLRGTTFEVVGSRKQNVVARSSNHLTLFRQTGHDVKTNGKYFLENVAQRILELQQVKSAPLVTTNNKKSAQSKFLWRSHQSCRKNRKTKTQSQNTGPRRTKTASEINGGPAKNYKAGVALKTNQKMFFCSKVFGK